MSLQSPRAARTAPARLKHIPDYSLVYTAYFAANPRKMRTKVRGQSRNVNRNQRLGGISTKVTKMTRIALPKHRLLDFSLSLRLGDLLHCLANITRPTTLKTRKTQNIFYAPAGDGPYSKSMTYMNGIRPGQTTNSFGINKRGATCPQNLAETPKPESRLKSMT